LSTTSSSSPYSTISISSYPYSIASSATCPYSTSSPTFSYLTNPALSSYSNPTTSSSNSYSAVSSTAPYTPASYAPSSSSYSNHRLASPARKPMAEQLISISTRGLSPSRQSSMSTLQALAQSTYSQPLNRNRSSSPHSTCRPSSPTPVHNPPPARSKRYASPSPQTQYSPSCRNKDSSFSTLDSVQDNPTPSSHSQHRRTSSSNTITPLIASSPTHSLGSFSSYSSTRGHQLQDPPPYNTIHRIVTNTTAPRSQPFLDEAAYGRLNLD